MHPSNQRGNILISALWLIVALTILVMALSFEARSDIERTMLHRDRARAYWLARAAVERVKFDVAVEKANPQQDLEGQGNGARFRYDFEGGWAECELQSNTSMMSVNSQNRDQWIQLLSLYELSDQEKDEIADAILDWQDEDDLVRIEGAEEDYYQTLSPPYMPRNGPFFSVDEILLVRGVSEAMYYGGNFGGFWKPGLKDICGVSRQNLARFDINTCPEGILMAFLEVTEEDAKAIIRQREEQAFANVQEASDFIASGNLENLNRFFMTYRGGQFTIRSTGYVYGSDARYTVEDEVRYTGGTRLYTHLSHKDFSLDHVDETQRDEDEL